MEATVKFMKIPWYIDRDPRLKPWMNIPRVNGLAVMWAVERMIVRLAEKPKEWFTITELTGGLYNKHLPYKVLKEIIVSSGFFCYVDGMVHYDWERFAQIPASNGSVPRKNEDSDSVGNPSVVRLKSVCNPSDTHGRDLKATNVDIDIDVDVDNNPPLKKEKEKKSEDVYESIIRKIVMEYDFRDGELGGWPGSSMEERKEKLTQYLIGMLNWQNSQRAERVGNNLGIEDYKVRWRDIVIAYIKQIDSSGYLSKMFNSTKVKLYLDIFASKADKTADTYQAGLQMLKEMDRMRKAKIEEEKKRFPFEDYDPERGTRYVGNDLIPWDAPPRPDSRSLWDDDDKQWVSPEVLDEKRAAGIARLEAMMAKHPLMTS